MIRIQLVASVVFFALVPLGARASAGDLAAVKQACGQPTGEHQGVSPATNRMERDLTYGSVILHFEPVENGWTFLSGWYDHLPLTETAAEEHMPCFAQAMASARAAAPASSGTNEDPTIRAQSAPPTADTSDFGVPHLRWILVLFAIVVICFFLPSARPRQRKPMQRDEARPRRRPLLERFARRSSSTRLDV